MTPVEKTLMAVGRALAGAREPWWIIGAAAVMLHRPERTTAIAPADVDVLLGLSDVDSLLRELEIERGADGGDHLFRSSVFVRWAGAGVPADLMAGFEHRGADGVWRPVSIQSRVSFTLAGVSLYAPDAEELATLLTLFARPKDLKRRALLED